MLPGYPVAEARFIQRAKALTAGDSSRLLGKTRLTSTGGKCLQCEGPRAFLRIAVPLKRGDPDEMCGFAWGAMSDPDDK